MNTYICRRIIRYVVSKINVNKVHFEGFEVIIFWHISSGVSAMN